MSEFWPSGMDLADSSSPLDILRVARREWETQSGGILTLEIQEAESTNKNHLLIVHAKHVPTNRTATLFSVVHRPGVAYPAKIQPRENELPDILKKSYYRPGISGTAAHSIFEGREVTNKWVCDTPSEFRTELREVFNLGTVKSEIVSLVAVAKSGGDAEKSADGSGGNSTPNEEAS